jgi:release factor glutamine methyltransferase
MLQNHATLKEVRVHLQRELSRFYPEGETSSMISMIMDHFGYSATAWILEPHHAAGADTVTQINEIVSEIHTHRPLQYILGYAQFCDLSIRVNANALIPRPETEEMVYRITEKIQKSPSRILDLGTGSGCIALALKKHFREATVVGLELSGPALDLARKNGLLNELEVEWIAGDMLAPEFPAEHANYDLVVSNPPYVLEKEKEDMDRNVLDFEPQAALFVEDQDPLKFYRAIAAGSEKLLSKGGALWVEINERFGAEVSTLFEKTGLTGITVYKDIHEKERFIEARK